MRDDVIAVAAFADRFEAELAVSALEAAGIEARVTADDAGGLRPALAFSNGVQVLVRAADLERAREVLDTPAVADPSNDD